MTSTPRFMRTLLLGAVAIALVSASGCSWFKSKSDYAQSTENRPLEVPPDLDLPDTSSATALPPTAGASAAAPIASDVRLDDSAVAAFPRIGTVLETIPGVVINGRAEALGSYDVTYQGQSFLIRVQDNAGGGSRLLALSADGRILGTGPAAELMATIKSKL